MCAVKHFLFVTILISSIPAGQSARAAEAPDPYARLAICVGRFSALLEHQWLIGGADANATATARQTMLNLLDTAPMSDPVAQLARRIEAKQLLARVLQRADLATASREKFMARARADHEIGECTALILG